MPKETRLTGGPAAPSPSTFGSQPIQLTDPRFVAQTNVVNPANQYQALQNILGLGSQIAGQAIESQNLEIKGILSVDAAIKSEIERNRIEAARKVAEQERVQRAADRLLSDKIQLSIANAGSTRESAEKANDVPTLETLRSAQLKVAADTNLTPEERNAAVQQASMAGTAIKGLQSGVVKDVALTKELAAYTVDLAAAKADGTKNDVLLLVTKAKENYKAALDKGDIEATKAWASVIAGVSDEPKRFDAEAAQSANQKRIEEDRIISKNIQVRSEADNRGLALDTTNLMTLVGQKNLSGVTAVKDGAEAYLKNTPPGNVSGINRYEALYKLATVEESQLIATSKQDAAQAERNAANQVERLVDTVLQDSVIQLTRPENLPKEVLDSKPGVVFKAAYDSLRDILPEEIKRILTTGSKVEQEAANDAIAKAAHAVVDAQTKQRNVANQQKANQHRIDTATDQLKNGRIEEAFGNLYQNENDPLTPAAASSALSAAALQVFPPGKLNQEHLRLATQFAESGIPALKKVGDEAIQRAERDFAQEEIDFRYPGGEYRLNEDNIVTDKQGKILNDPDIQKGWGNKFTDTGKARDWWMELRGMQKDADGNWPQLGPLAPSYKRFITEVQSDIERTNKNMESSLLRIAKDPTVKADSKTRWKASALKTLLDEDRISGLSIEAATGLLQSEVQLLADTPPEMLTAIKSAVADSNNATFATAFFRVYDPGSFPNVAEAIGSSGAFKIAHQASILFTLYSEQGTLSTEQIMTKVADFSRSQQERSDTNRLPVPKAQQDQLDAARGGVVTNVTSHFNVQYENLNQLDQNLLTDFADMSTSIPDLPAADRAKFVIRMMSSVGYVSINRADGFSDIVYNPQTVNGRALPATEDIKSAGFSLYLTSLAPAVATYMSTLPVIDTGVIKTVAISADKIKSIEPAPTDFYTSRGFSPVRVTMKSGEVYEIDPEKSGISVTEAKFKDYFSTHQDEVRRLENNRTTNPFSLG